MMTIYEQVQRALDFIEAGLFSPLLQEDAAREAGMSLRSFHRYFWAVTGYSYKEYLVKRRLGEAAKALLNSERGILELALDIGYGSHEAFSRAFKKEFEISPLRFRQCRQGPKGLARIKLFKEMYMGVIIKELPRMRALAFEGFEPEPEYKAKAKLEAWIAEHPAKGKPRRIFGHDTDAEGRPTHGPEHAGYKFLATIEGPDEARGAKTEVIEAGSFAVTGIEGNLESDPAGTWITEGWRRMTAMIAEKGYRVKSGGRCLEEELEPAEPGNLRLDLYLEID